MPKYAREAAGGRFGGWRLFRIVYFSHGAFLKISQKFYIKTLTKV